MFLGSLERLTEQCVSGVRELDRQVQIVGEYQVVLPSPLIIHIGSWS